MSVYACVHVAVRACAACPVRVYLTLGSCVHIATAVLWASAGGLPLAPHLVKLTQQQTATTDGSTSEREQQRDVQ